MTCRSAIYPESDRNWHSVSHLGVLLVGFAVRTPECCSSLEFPTPPSPAIATPPPNPTITTPPPSTTTTRDLQTTSIDHKMSDPLPRILVLISGNGSNLQALIDATATTPPLLPATIAHVLSNKKSAYGLTRAHNSSIPTTYHNLVPYKKRHAPDQISLARQEYDAELARLIIEQKPDLVVCAGWMHILSPAFLVPLEQNNIIIINLHPALPGQFDGANAIERSYQAWKNGEIKKTGVMIHYVIQDVDRGEPILVREVEFKEGEGLEELEGRIHAVEHEAIVEGTVLALEQMKRRAQEDAHATSS
ncbi:formyl transferase-domain-containing protein [Peziza echinospora]|nr:formyl transferase-domain-containing protein [Peziza echinospora]